MKTTDLKKFKEKTIELINIKIETYNLSLKKTNDDIFKNWLIVRINCLEELKAEIEKINLKHFKNNL